MAIQAGPVPLQLSFIQYKSSNISTILAEHKNTNIQATVRQATCIIPTLN